MLELLDETLDKLRDHFYADSIPYSVGEEYNYTNEDIDPTAEFVQLRMDWELDEDESLTEEEKIDVMITVIRQDLVEILVNGDKKSSDPLLINLDGSLKRNKEATTVDIFRATLKKEYKEVKNTTEYTLYFTMATRW